MIKLSAFADEISKDLTEQMDVLEEGGIKYIELRAVWGTNVLKLTDDEVATIKEEIRKRGFKISAIGSPLGKIMITDDFNAHLKDVERAIQVAKELEAPYVRVFSFFIPEHEDPALYRSEVMARMKAMVQMAEDAGVVLLHENEKKIYGDITERCVDLLRTIDSKFFRATFDPANFLQCGVKVYEDAYPKLEDYIEYMHIKDYSIEKKYVTVAGEGDGDFKEILSALKSRNYKGFMSLEPHLSHAGGFSGFSGPELFRLASRGLKKLLDEVGYNY